MLLALCRLQNTKIAIVILLFMFVCLFNIQFFFHLSCIIGEFCPAPARIQILDFAHHRINKLILGSRRPESNILAFATQNSLKAHSVFQCPKSNLNSASSQSMSLLIKSFLVNGNCDCNLTHKCRTTLQILPQFIKVSYNS